MKLTTQLRLNNGERYPVLVISWEQDKDGLGYTGIVRKWLEKDKTPTDNNVITLRQTIPLGRICVQFQPCKGGCWKSAHWEGTTLTERDLQWATAWAELAKESYDDIKNS